MSSRHPKTRRFDACQPEISAPEWNGLSLDADAAAMRELRHASEAVLHLATQAHAAVACSDVVSAEAARKSLEKQLTLARGLIDELLFGAPGESVLH
ncbi:hypothetical protein [Paraburkholderia sp. ZP32-5]|jgi:hypothetical protein|uniref:hypothetical protein n=1 Tax=Paraburkholderia sp. ZP32-5 TaxID=2883245 RepID=UPI001F2A33FC|nr:hypothetical protein [Paraburkholderia sp. ZP32-5]